MENLRTEIKKFVERLSMDEIKERLVEYMAKERCATIFPVALSVKNVHHKGTCSQYNVYLTMNNGAEVEVKFPDRPSRLIYIYTLLHPEGFQRRMLEKNNYKELADLFIQLFATIPDKLFYKSVKKDFNHYVNDAIAKSRRAIRAAVQEALLKNQPHSELWNDIEIANPSDHNGRTVIPFAKDRERVIVDEKLSA